MHQGGQKICGGPTEELENLDNQEFFRYYKNLVNPETRKPGDDRSRRTAPVYRPKRKDKATMKKTVLLLLFLFNVMPASAETIELTSGEIVQGQIIERTDKSIKVDRGFGVNITYYPEDVESIDGQPFSPPSSEKDQRKNGPPARTQVIEGEVGSRFLAKNDGGLGQIVLLLADGKLMKFWVKKNASFEGKKSLKEFGTRDYIAVTYSESGDKKYAKHIKLLSEVEKSVQLITAFPKNTQDHTDEIVKQGKLAEAIQFIATRKDITSGYLGKITLNLPDDTGVTIFVPKNAIIEGLNSSFGKLMLGDTLSVTYVLIDRQNFAKRIKVISKSKH